MLALLLAACASVAAPRLSAQDEAPAAGSLSIDASAPAAAVESLHRVILEAMRMPGDAAYPDRLATLDPVVRALFDFPTIARLVLGSHWRSLSGADRERFLDTFTRYSVASYAAEFDSFSGHEFETRDVKMQRENIAIVRAALTSGAGETHDFAYQLREKRDRWLIVGVAVDGVNDIALKRSQYDAILKKNGFEALLETLEEKIRNFARGEEEDD